MKYRDLRDFLAGLEARGELKRITATVDPCLEMTEVCDRVLKAGGPALVQAGPSCVRGVSRGCPEGFRLLP